MAGLAPLAGVFRVVDLSAGIAGAYCTKVLADAGAEVIVVEPPEGHPLRRRSASGRPTDPDYGGVLFQFLSCSKASVVVDLDDADDVAFVYGLVRGADAVVWGEESALCRDARLSPERIRSLAPQVTVLAITPFGLDSPWRGRPANEFILQSMSGSAWNHGPSDAAPTMFGGSQGEYGVGIAGAMGLLVSRWRTMRSGEGEIIDLAGLDVLHLTQLLYPVPFLDLTGRPYRSRRVDNIPGVHRTKDNRWVGLWVTTGQQWLDFCVLVGREDWLEDASLGLMDNRSMRSEELVGAIDAWASERDAAEIVELASAFRLPVAEVVNGQTLPEQEQYVARNWYTKHPRSGVLQPEVWYTLSGGAERAAPLPSPRLGQDTERLRAQALSPLLPVEAAPARSPELPLAGLRVADMTAFWAGPIISHPLALLGADVIHVESAQRPDGIRMAMTRPMTAPGWWESSPYFNGTNTCKRDLTLDLAKPAGREAMLKLIAECDVLIENYSPRVMGQLGLDYETLRAIRPDLVMVRAPAFGTSGPWENRVAYAPIIDEASGLAWVTGTPEGRPQVVGAASDSVGGMHGTVALLLALEHRRRTGQGMLVETPQIGAALNVSAEQVIEFSAHGVVLNRMGNRSWTVAPQGVYRARDRVSSFDGVPPDDWVAISVETDAQWAALCEVIGSAELAEDEALRSVEGRRAHHDRIDAALSAWCAPRSAAEAADLLAAAGVPATAVIPTHELAQVPPAVARGLYETVTHPVVGQLRIVGWPMRSSAGPRRWHRSPAPCLGQDNHDILQGLLGMTSAEVEQLRVDGVIGTEVQVNLGW